MKRPSAMTKHSLCSMALSAILVAGCAGATSTPIPATATASPATATLSPATQRPTPTAVIPTPAPSVLPVVETPMEGPTVIDVATEEVATVVVPPHGATIMADGVTVAVPAGGVAGDTTVVVKRLNAPFHMNVFAPSDPTGVAAIPIGHPYDFGPAGVQFAQPVEVTLPYDPQYVPAGIDPGRLAAAYFNGTRWVVAGGEVDPAAHTVTVRLQTFDGIIWVVVLTTLVIGIPVVPRVVNMIFGGEGTKSDPISEKQAEKWITPDDPAVKEAAAKATVGGVPLGDKQKLAEYLTKNEGKNPPVTFVGPDGKPLDLRMRASDTNWQKPVDFLTLTTGDDGKVNGMSGDCTSVTSTMVSMFRALGYPAKAVFGYREDKAGDHKNLTHPHAWGEVLIGGRVYFIDEEGKLQPLEKGLAAIHLFRPAPDDPRFDSMWNEEGQIPYVESWWTGEYELSGSWTGTFRYSEIDIDPAMRKQAEEMAKEEGCDLTTALDQIKGKALPMTLKNVKVANGKGTGLVFIDFSAFKDSKGKPVQKMTPTKVTFTYSGNRIVFTGDLSKGGGSMSGVVTWSGGVATMTGTAKQKGKGYSTVAVWSLSPD